MALNLLKIKDRPVSNGLLERDYDEIDRDLLGKKHLEPGDLKVPDSKVAPAQGNPFLDRVLPLSKILRRFRVIYRD